MTQEPVMVLPNGDILRKGDYAQLYSGKIVGPLKYKPKTEPHWKLAGIWYTPDGAFYPWGSDSGQDILAKAVWSTNGEKPMTKTYREVMDDLNVAAYAALRAAGNEDGAPVEALREIAAEIDSLIDHGVTRAEMRDTPALWRDMTPEEKGALLLGWQQGKEIQVYNRSGYWFATKLWPQRWDRDAYRIKPEPKRETLKLYGKNGWYDPAIGTIDLIDGKPDPASIKIKEQGQ